MKRISVLAVIFCISFFICGVYQACAECYDEDTCFKDYVTKEDNNIVLAVNRDTNEVELYWSEKDNAWLKPDTEQQQEFQKIYNKKIRLQRMQQFMDRMHQATWFNTNQSGSGRR